MGFRFDFHGHCFCGLIFSLFSYIFNFVEILLQSYIPKTLEDVKNAEEDVQRITSGKDTKDLYYQTITGLKHALSLTQTSQQKTQQQKSSPTKDSPVISDDKSNLLEDDAEGQSGKDEDDESDSEEDSCSESEVEDPADIKAARKEARKENKKFIVKGIYNLNRK